MNVVYIQTCKYHAWTTEFTGKSVEDEDGFQGETEGLKNTHPHTGSWPVVIQSQRKETARLRQSIGTIPLSGAFLSTTTKPLTPSPSLYATTSWQTECSDLGQLRDASRSRHLACNTRPQQVQYEFGRKGCGGVRATDILGHGQHQLSSRSNSKHEYPGLSPKRNTIKGVHVAHHRASTATGGCKVVLAGKHCFIGSYETTI